MPKSYNGIGTTFMGQREFRLDGSYITTEFFIFLLFPILPLRSYRVIPLGRNKYRLLEQLPWDRRQALSLQGTAFASILLPVIFVASGVPRALGGDFSKGLAVFLFAAPLLLGWVVRWMAKRRALEAAAKGQS